MVNINVVVEQAKTYVFCANEEEESILRTLAEEFGADTAVVADVVITVFGFF